MGQMGKDRNNLKTRGRPKSKWLAAFMSKNYGGCEPKGGKRQPRTGKMRGNNKETLYTIMLTSILKSILGTYPGFSLRKLNYYLTSS